MTGLLRTCADCKETKPRIDFSTKTVRGRPTPESYCKPCKAARGRRLRRVAKMIGGV